MVGQFLRSGEIADLKRGLDRTNSKRKREGLLQHPTRAVVCGCPDPDCGGWHTIDLARKILTPEEGVAELKAHSRHRKATKRNRGKGNESDLGNSGEECDGGVGV